MTSERKKLSYRKFEVVEAVIKALDALEESGKDITQWFRIHPHKRLTVELSLENDRGDRVRNYIFMDIEEGKVIISVPTIKEDESEFVS